MYILFITISVVMSFDLILSFNYSASSLELFSSIPENIQPLLTLHKSLQISDYIVVSATTEISFKGIPNLCGVHEDKSLSHKSLTFLSETNGHKAAELIQAKEFWTQGLTGAHVKIGILDSGFSSTDENFIKIADCINFTEDPDCEDKTGHGTFMASTIISTHPDCPGIAPDAEVYSLKVFSNSHESHTSWFLEAFQFAILNNITILSLSTGGIDFNDEPFVKKIQELVSKGIIIVSAAGNDGPGFGTMSNPGDQGEVIGVGGLDETGMHVAEFSSRGPTLWEIHGGIGRFKPDILTYSVNILGYYQGRCTSNSGTSVSTPIVVGSIALLMDQFYSPGVIKQALMTSAKKLENFSVFEQGAGKMDLIKTQEFVNLGEFGLYAFPSNFNDADEYFFPYSLQPLHVKSPPILLNFTITHPDLATAELKILEITKGYKLNIAVEVVDVEAFTGYVGVFISALQANGIEKATIIVGAGNLTVSIPLMLRIGNIPKKEHRVLWDLGHNLKFPEAGLIIRDESEGAYLFDWRGDHPFTNHLNVYKTLIDSGFIVDFLYDDFSCIDGNLYSVYLLIDPERSYSPYEISKIQYDMELKKTSLVIFSEWGDYSTLQVQLSYSNFTTALPGSNINTINTLLSPYFIELSQSKSFSDTGRIHSQKFSVTFYIV